MRHESGGESPRFDPNSILCAIWQQSEFVPKEYLHVIPQHQLLGIRVQVHLLVHPVGNRMPVEVMLEPVRSYVRGTIGGSSPCR